MAETYYEGGDDSGRLGSIGRSVAGRRATGDGQPKEALRKPGRTHFTDESIPRLVDHDPRVAGGGVLHIADVPERRTRDLEAVQSVGLGPRDDAMSSDATHGFPLPDYRLSELDWDEKGQPRTPLA